jgi:hypothetical protein
MINFTPSENNSELSPSSLKTYFSIFEAHVVTWEPGDSRAV